MSGDKKALDRIIHKRGGVVQLAAAGEEAGDGRARVRILANTGKPWKLWGSTRAAVDLASLQYSDKAPLLYDHNTGDVIGLTDSATMTDEGFVQEGRLFSKSERAREIRDNSQDGLQYQASIGFKIGTLERVEGEDVKCNGYPLREGDYIMKGCKLLETSITLFGRDDATATEVLRLSINEAEKGMKMADSNKASTDAPAEAETKTPTQAKDTGYAEAPATFQELSAEFQGDPEFIVLALSESLTMRQAQKKHLTREREKLQREREELAAEREQAQSAESVKTPPAPTQSLGAKPVGVQVSDEDRLSSLPWDEQRELGVDKEDLAAYAKYKHRVKFIGDPTLRGFDN